MHVKKFDDIRILVIPVAVLECIVIYKLNRLMEQVR